VWSTEEGGVSNFAKRCMAGILVTVGWTDDRQVKAEVMPVRMVVVLDCADADALAEFWSAALGLRRGSFHPPYVRLSDPTERWPNLLLQQVPEAKSGKNRMHLDIQVVDVDSEVERLIALGARVVQAPHDDNGYLTTILADPQGNEFCVIRPPEGGYDWRRLQAEDAGSADVATS
jgi:predicted enzyme related to lactoylglutathione lyase